MAKFGHLQINDKQITVQLEQSGDYYFNLFNNDKTFSDKDIMTAIGLSYANITKATKCIETDSRIYKELALAYLKHQALPINVHIVDSNAISIHDKRAKLGLSITSKLVKLSVENDCIVLTRKNGEYYASLEFLSNDEASRFMLHVDNIRQLVK